MEVTVTISIELLQEALIALRDRTSILIKDTHHASQDVREIAHRQLARVNKVVAVFQEAASER